MLTISIISVNIIGDFNMVDLYYMIYDDICNQKIYEYIIKRYCYANINLLSLIYPCTMFVLQMLLCSNKQGIASNVSKYSFQEYQFYNFMAKMAEIENKMLR